MRFLRKKEAQPVRPILLILETPTLNSAAKASRVISFLLIMLFVFVSYFIVSYFLVVEL